MKTGIGVETLKIWRPGSLDTVPRPGTINNSVIIESFGGVFIHADEDFLLRIHVG